MKITHLTTVHPRNDVRVLHKQCVTLASSGFNTTLIVADGIGNEVYKNVQILDIGDFRTNRIQRLTKAKNIILKYALETDSDAYQIHDPELLSVGVKLKKKGKKVIFDSHEDVPKQILYKTWLGPIQFRKLLARLYNRYEKKLVSKFDGLISVIDEITDKFECVRRITIKNYPVIEAYRNHVISTEDKKKQIVYVGSITKERGIFDCIQAMKYLPTGYELILVGKFQSEKFKAECESLAEWSRVNYIGFKPMNEVAKILGESYIGLSVLHPEKNYLTSLPTKGFEYIAAGTPIVMSNFEYWRPYFKECGILVSPQSPDLIANALNRLIEDKDFYRKCKEIGLERSRKYSWENESLKYIEFFRTI